MKNTMVLYHGQCPDGFGAAFAAWLVLQDDADYMSCVYGGDPPDVTGKRVYILDFSFDVDVLERMDLQAAELILIDHHKTAADKLRGFKCRCGSVTLDLGRSGAMLAWQHFHPDVPVPRLIAHIQDRDLWTWKLAASRDYLAALDFVGFDFEAWRNVMELTESQEAQFIARGRAMNDQFQSLCDAIADPKSVVPAVLLGHQGLMVNANAQFASDVGNRLALRSGTFGLVWRIDKPDTVKVGLRSIAPFDVEKIASAFGGGGHPQASAFRIPVARLVELLEGRLAP